MDVTQAVSETLESKYKLKSLKLSTIAISSVVLVEVILGLLAGSLAVVSDGLHALFDALTTLMLFIVTRESLKPPDEEHMYGHEKFEPIGGLVGGIALIGVALLILYEAISKIVHNQAINTEMEYVGFVAIGFTFCIDFFRVGIFSRARASESSTMKAGLYHAVADLSSTVIALIGFGLATLGISVGDALASVVLSVILSFLSARLVWSSGMELSDRIPKEVADKVRKEILGISGVCKCEDLKIRKTGNKAFVRATLQVPDYLGLEEAHELTSEIEANIKKTLGNADVTIHTEPYETEMPTEKLVEKLATEVDGVKEAHEINTAYTDGKLYITLHVYVDPKLSVEESHEITERIENRIRTRITNLENVAVHVEPFSSKKRRGSMVDKNEIAKVVYDMLENRQRTFHVKRIMTYVVGKKRYVNIDCCFTHEISVEEAHNIASLIEEQIRQHFLETMVTVHIEPS